MNKNLWRITLPIKVRAAAQPLLCCVGDEDQQQSLDTIDFSTITNSIIIFYRIYQCCLTKEIRGGVSIVIVTTSYIIFHAATMRNSLKAYLIEYRKYNRKKIHLLMDCKVVCKLVFVFCNCIDSFYMIFLYNMIRTYLYIYYTISSLLSISFICSYTHSLFYHTSFIYYIIV